MNSTEKVLTKIKLIIVWYKIHAPSTKNFDPLLESSLDIELKFNCVAKLFCVLAVLLFWPFFVPTRHA